MIFLIILVVGVALVEYNFPFEGFRFGTQSDISCRNRTALCFGLRTIRSVGVFGFASMLVKMSLKTYHYYYYYYYSWHY